MESCRKKKRRPTTVTALPEDAFKDTAFEPGLEIVKL
jgi:hypothetical protein